VKYTVLWSPEAENRLAELWNSASDRKAVTDAANAMDRLLATNPHQLGGARPDGTCVSFMPPLGFLFNVVEADRTVSVLKIWSFKKRK
jgi:plasmid stabilization system protein ParE